jgi:hypothetical protein
MTPARHRSPCPCCGHLVHDEQPGSYLVCPVCFWEDDLVQLRWPLYTGGADKQSLSEAQQNYLSRGASDPRFTRNVRPPNEDEPVEEGFRPINLSLDSFEETSVQEEPWPVDRTVLYWWRATFWRRVRKRS